MFLALRKLFSSFNTDTVEQPDFRGPAGAFAEYPYLLPCAVLTVYNWFTALVTFFCLPETNIHRKPLRKVQATKPPEEQPLLPSSENSRSQAHMSAVFLIIMGQGWVDTTRSMGLLG